MSQRSRQIVAGVLFLAAFIVYGTGSVLATGFVAGLASSVDPAMLLANYGSTLVNGVTLMLLNSAIVLGIGVLLFSSLARANRVVSWVYLLARGGEAVLLGLGAFGFLTVLTRHSPHVVASVQSGNFFAYQTGMAVLGFGSLFLCALLYRHRLVPRPLALWGFGGYALLLAGALLELSGVHYGLALAIPGGLFELVFGVWLISRGLAPVGAASATSAGRASAGN